MKLDGQQIAETMYEDLKRRVGELKKIKVTPHLVVFLVGKNPASVAYVTLKQKKGEEIGAKVTVMNFDTKVTTEELVEKIKLLNDDPYVHGILVQRPLPDHVDVAKIEAATNPEKDIDGFHPNSPYILPLPLAVGKILEEVFKMTLKQNTSKTNQELVSFRIWLTEQNIVLIGKGPTGGGPIKEYFRKLGVAPHIIDSKTKDPDKLMQEADIIISAAGKPNIVTAKNTKQGAVLISVGIFRDAENKLSGDYNEKEISKKAGYFTPTPGGVGPVNVAKLMENLLTAAEKQTKA